MLTPKTYFEIGVNKGHTLELSNCDSIGVDPDFLIDDPAIIRKILKNKRSFFFSLGSDDFFESYDPEILLGKKIDFAFLDGMHRSEYLLRDFLNTEKFVKKNSIIALHDCLPLDVGMADRVQGGVISPVSHRAGWWAGDVWRAALALKRYRPEIKILALDAPPTGLILCTNLDPENRYLETNYSTVVSAMLGWDLDEMGLQSLYDELDVQSTSLIDTHTALTAQFWL